MHYVFFAIGLFNLVCGNYVTASACFAIASWIIALK